MQVFNRHILILTSQNFKKQMLFVRAAVHQDAFFLQRETLKLAFLSLFVVWHGGGPYQAVLRAYSRFCAQGSLLAGLGEQVLGVKPETLHGSAFDRAGARVENARPL